MQVTQLPNAAVRRSSRRWHVALALTVILGGLTAAVAVGAWPVSVDREVAKVLPASPARGVAGVLLTVADAVTTLGTPVASLLTILALSAWLTWRERNLGALRTVTPPTAALVVSVLAGKALLARPGPPSSHLHGLLGYYPSGHTTTALVCSGVLARLIGARYPNARRRLSAAAMVWTLVLGSSLVFHRYHWLSDVLAGLLLGALILTITTPAEPASVAANGELQGPG